MGCGSVEFQDQVIIRVSTKLSTAYSLHHFLPISRIISLRKLGNVALPRAVQKNHWRKAYCKLCYRVQNAHRRRLLFGYVKSLTLLGVDVIDPSEKIGDGCSFASFTLIESIQINYKQKYTIKHKQSHPSSSHPTQTHIMRLPWTVVASTFLPSMPEIL